MGMNKNTVLGWATLIMIVVGLGLIAIGIFKYREVSAWGFAAVGFGFFSIAWVFNALKGRV
ncbi:MAG: CAL67264 family membrane protein [Polaribacter sp.]|uniref:CAL67264 family membrane protein n=1 Tax=Polaribacter sp. TaxID=1920175 RepID=UPI003265275A